MARFANGKAPFLRLSDASNQGTGVIMRDFLIGLLPVILFAWYKNGIQVYIDGNITFFEMLYPLIFILLGGLISTVFESLFFIITDPSVRTLPALSKKLSVSYAMIPGLILAMVLPLYTPIWVLMFGAFMGTIVGKMLFGGFGNNLFNPALLGYVAIGFTMLGIIGNAGGVMNASEVLIDSYGGVTPLNTLAAAKEIDYDLLVKPYGSLWNFFIGTIPGALAETGSLAIIVAYIWLSIRKVIKWFTPLIYVGTVFVLSWLIGIGSGEAGLWFPLYSILSGGLMFGAVFMATEPVTTPRNPLGKIVFALFLGVLTVLFRFIGNLPEGVGTAIIVMNIFTMPIDKMTAVMRAQGVKKTTVPSIIGLSVFWLVLVLYAVIKAPTIYNAILSVFPIGLGGF